MSVKVIAAVWDHSWARGVDRLVLLSIADNAQHDGGGAYPSRAEIARKALIAPSTVQAAVKRLVELGELEVEPRGWTPAGRRSNGYRVLLPGLEPSTGSRSMQPSTHRPATLNPSTGLGAEPSTGLGGQEPYEPSSLEPRPRSSGLLTDLGRVGNDEPSSPARRAIENVEALAADKAMP